MPAARDDPLPNRPPYPTVLPAQPNPTLQAIEDDIRADLAKVGISAVARFLEKDDLNAAMVAGDFDLVFSETWGAPCEY